MNFSHTFASFFRNKKQQPIRRARKPWSDAPRMQVEQLEDRIVPTTISQWQFTSIVAAPDNSPAATTDTTGGTAQLTTLGMTNSYNGGNTASDDIENPGDANVPAELGLRVRGAQTPTGHNGWADYNISPGTANGAPEYSQGIELNTSSANYTNIQFSFDWSSTAQGVRDLQVQYDLNATGAAGGGANVWAYVPGSGTSTVVNSSIGGTYIATPGNWYSATTPDITVSLPASANNDPNLGVRLVSAFDSTQNVVGDYAAATLTGGSTVKYNNSSGNWQFNNMTFSGTPQGATPTTADAPTLSPTGSNPYGTMVSFTAVVHASNGSNPPTAGSVTFMNGSTVLATSSSFTLGSPSSTATTFVGSSTTDPVGTYSNITAVYNAGTGFTGSTSSASASTLTIQGISTTTAVPTFSPTTATTNQPVSFTAVVTAGSGSTAPTAGTVVFMNGSTVLATSSSETPSGANATFTITTDVPVGTYNNITAVYSGNGGFLTSTSSASSSTLTVSPVTAPAGAIAQWTFENDAIANNNSPTPSYGAGVASALGMTNSLTASPSINTDDVLLGVSGDTGSNGLADITNIWRIRGNGASPNNGNGWDSAAAIGTQGAEFATSTLNDGGPITITFDWYATTQGEGNMMLEYTTNGTTWNNLQVTVPSSDTGIAAIDNTNASDTNTVQGWYVQMTGQQWAQGLTATISDPAAANNPNFAVEMVNASTGADCISAAGTALNNTSGNWRFDNITLQAQTPNFTPGNLVELQVGNSTTTYQQAPVYLDEITPAGASVQQIGVSSSSGAAGISAATESGTTVTVTTSTTALYAVGESITLSGIVSGSGSGASAWDITAPVATVISSTQFTIQAPASLPAITSLTAAQATPPNQPLTISLSQPISVGQLNRSADGSALTFAGVDSGTDVTTTSPTPLSTDGRDVGVVSGNPNYPSDINTSTYGAWNGGDDTRTAISETAYGPIYEVGHNNDVSGFPAYVGVHEFPTEGSGPTLGTQVSAASNIRGITIGPDNRMYFVTAAGVSSVGTAAGVYTDAAALPATNSATPSADIMVVPNFVTNAKLNGMYIADMNGTGVISNGDRLYYINGDTATGAGAAGLFEATWNTSNAYPWDTPNNAGAQAAGILDYWGVPVRLGDAPVQTGSTSIGTLIGIAGTVLSLNNGNTPGTVELYTNAHDTTAGDASIIQQWMDSGSGVTITSAQVSGTTVTITTASPINFTNNEWVAVNGIGNGGGNSYSVTGATASLVTTGDDGTFQVTVTGTNTFTYTDGNSGLVSITNAGGVGSADAAIISDLSQANTYSNFGIGLAPINPNNGLADTFGGTIVQTLAGGTDGSINKPQVTIGGISFAPVAATTVTLADNSGTLTATLTNNQVPPSGQVAFINENTGAVLGFGTISSSAPYTATLADSTVVGDAYVEAYFAGGGSLALAPAQSNIIQVNNAGTTTDSVSVSPSLPAVAVNTPVTLTATVTPSSGPTGNVSFYNTTGSVPPSLSNLIGTVALTGNTAALTAAFANTGIQTITAVYNGDATYESSSNFTTVNVAQNATAAITASANPATISTAPSYTVTLTGNSTLGTPTGTVIVTIVSATNNTSGHPAISTTSAAITLAAGSGNTATAVWNSSNATPPPSLTDGGSYLVTMTYTPAGGSGYSAFSISPEASGANYTNTALIENVNKAFTPGNVVLVQRGDGTIQTGSSGGLVELDEYTPTGTEVQSIILPNSPTGSNNPFVSGSQNGSLGLINRSVNGADLTLIGYDTELGTQFLTSSFPYTIPRTIAEVGSGGAGAVNTTTAISSTSPTSVPYEQEDAVSYDGNQFWIVSALPPGDTTESGIEYASSLGATSATQLTAAGTTGTAINIAGGQLYVTGGSGNINAVGAGLPSTTAQSLTGLPNLQAQYQFNYPTKASPEQVLLLNTTDGTTNNPNVAYVADQDYGLLKFSLNNVALSLSSSGTTATATVSSGSLYFLSNGTDQVQITGAPGYNGIYTLPAANISGTGGVGTTFTFTTTGSSLASSTGTGGQWLYGQYGTGVFGEKLVSAGGVTGVTGNVVNPGASGYSVSLYVSGANVQGLNPNEFAFLSDTNAASAGFPSGNFTIEAVDGASGFNGGTSNANANFAGIAFVPGATTTTTVTSSVSPTTYGTNVTFSATLTAGTGGVTPTGTVSFYDGITLLGTSPITTVSGNQVASFTTTSYLSLGKHTISAVFYPGGQALADDDVSTGTFTEDIDYDPPAVDLVTTQVGFNSPIASVSVSGSTVTVTTSEYLPFALNSTGLSLTIAGNSGTNINGTYPITLLSPTSFSYTAGLGTPIAGSSGTVSLGLASVGVTATTVATVGGVTTVTVTTSASSGFSSGQLVTIAGTAGGTNINGNFILTSASGTTLKYISSGAVAATTFTGATADSVAPLTGSATAAYLDDSTIYNIATTGSSPNEVPTIAVSGSGAGTTVTVTTTSSSTDYVVGEEVTISGTTGGTGINGTFAITAVSGGTFTYASPNAVAPTGVIVNSTNSTVNVNGVPTASGWNANNTVYLPTAATPATISGAAWNVSKDVVTVTTLAAHNMQAGQLVTITGAGNFNGTFTILSVPTTTSFTYGLLSDPGASVSSGSAQVDQAAFTEVGTATTSSYITNSLDGHSLELAGNDGSLGVVAVVSPDGTVNDSTLMPAAVGATRAVASTDGSGFWVTTATSGLVWVPFGGSTPSAVSAASWSSTNGGTVTITAPNSYVSGQKVSILGITPAAYSGTFTVISATSTQFTYALIQATSPGTATLTNATSQVVPTQISLEANNPNNGQTPSTVTIGGSPSGTPNQLLGDAGNQFQTNGVPSIDGPFTVGAGLPTTGGQPIGVLGTGTGQNFPNSTDKFGGFPTSAQFAVSPDGQTIFVADSRTDSLGGILEYYQATPGQWDLLGQLFVPDNFQLDNFSITSATESGTTVTITTSAPTDFYVGESVSVDGVQLAAYDGSGNIVTSVSGNTFTYTSSFTGLASSSAGPSGAFATGADGGFRGLVANWTDSDTNPNDPVTLYVTTSSTSGNRLIEITGGTGSAANNNGQVPAFAYTVLATSAANTAFRGVAIAPTVTGTTATTTSLVASGNSLTATVTSGSATGWVSFYEANGSNPIYLGTGSVSSGTATLNTTGTLPAGSYNVYAVYTGDTTFAASTSSQVSDTVSLISTTTTLSFSPNPVGTTQSDILTATISGGTGQAPTGLVTFTNTTSSTILGYGTVSQLIQNEFGQPVVTFVATLTVPAGTFASGTFSITAGYSGDGYFASSTDTEMLNVVNSTVTTVTTSAANPTATSAGTALTLSATVTSTGGTPGGTVQFYDDTLPLGTPVTVNGSGVATLPIVATLVQSVTVLSASESTTGSTTTVVITTDATNPMFVGEEVVVEGLGSSYDSTSPDAPLPNPSQFFTVTAVSGTTFSYVDNNASGATTDTKGGLAIGLNVVTPGMHSISAVYTPTGSNVSSFASSTGVHEQTVHGQTLGTSDVYQERNGDGITSLNSRAPNPALGSIGVTVYIDELTPSGTLVQSFALPTADSQFFTILSSSWTSGTETITLTSPTDYAVGTLVTINPNAASGYTATVAITAVGTNSFSYAAASNPGTITGTVQGVVHAVVGDGQQSTTGQMSLSGDGQDLFLTGYDNNPLPFGTANSVPSGSTASSVPRSIAQISSNGTIQTEAFTLGATGIDAGTGLINGVYSPDGNQFYLSAATGIYYFPNVQVSATLQGSSPADLIDAPGTSDGLESYNGNLYVIGAGGSGGTSNFVEQQLPKATDVVITNITWASGVATVTGNNSFSAGQDVTISGVTGTTGTSYNGTWAIASASGTSFTFNLATQPTGTPAFGSSTASFQPLTGMPIADVQTITNATWASSVATITANNDFAVGERVLVSGITTATGYNGTITITSIVTSGGAQTGFTYALTTQPTGTPGFTGATASLQSAQLQVAGIPVNTTSEPVPVFFGVDAYFTHTNGAGTALDTIYLADDGKSFGGGDITKWSLTSVGITSITQSGTTATVNLSSSALNLAAGIGENITISGETGAAAGYNGTWAITEVTPTQFHFTAPGNLSGDASPSGSATGFTETGAVLYTDAVQQLGFYWLAGTTNPSTHAVTLYTTYGNGGNGDFGPGITYQFIDSNGFNNAPGVPVTAASWSSGTATITAANNFQVGQLVTIAGITGATGFNGLFTILTANSTSFTYALSTNPGTATTTGSYAVSLDTVNTVAFEGFGSYVGNETSRGVALAPQAMTTTLVDNGPNPSTYVQSFTLTVTVASPGSINVPSGTITLEDASNGNAVVPTTGNTLSNGSATLTVAAGALSVGTHNLFVVYNGDVYHQSQNSATVSQVVTQASTTTTLSSSPSSTVYGQNVAFVVSVSPTVPAGETLNLVDTNHGNAIVGTGTTTVGATTINIVALSIGTHTIVAVYVGDTNYATSTSSSVTQTVTTASSATTLTDNGPNPSTSGAAVSFTVTVAPVSPSVGGTQGSSFPTGTVQLEDASNGNAPVGSPQTLGAGGTVTFNVSSLSVGTHNLFAVYGGDTNYAGSTSNTVSQVVNSSGAAPAVSSVVVNGGAPAYTDSNGLQVSLAGQNSVVEQILVTFNEAVTLSGTPFTVSNDTNANVSINSGPQPNTLPVTASYTVVPGSNNTQYIVTFSGTGTNAIPGGTGRTIKDGIYFLNVVGTNVTANSQHASNTSTGFWALYGSADNNDNSISPTFGDGNSEVFVDIGDFNQFRATYGSESDIPGGPPVYNAAYDSNLDGFVDITDFNKFRTNYGADWSF